MNKTDYRARLKANAKVLSAAGQDSNSSQSYDVFGPKPDQEGGAGKNNILGPLYNTGGIIFPYTPTVMFGGIAKYETYNFTHTNYTQNSYTHSAPNDINITAKFTSTTDAEARYTLAMIRFFSAITKSQFGEKAGTKAGTPPSLLYFDYLGKQMFHNVPVVVTSFSSTIDDKVDYVPVVIGGDINNMSYVPTEMTIQVMLSVQQNPYKTKKEFSLDDFRQGNLLGGFI